MRARIRTIKPEAFEDEKLWDVEVESGLPIFRAFAGLWCVADREGRFEWRHRPLKAAVLPYWNGSFEAVLDTLEAAGFIRRYVVDGKPYGLVVNFTRHQAINNREADSDLPGPDQADRDEAGTDPDDPPPSTRGSRDGDASGTRQARVDDASGTRDAREGSSAHHGEIAKESTRAARVSHASATRHDLAQGEGEREGEREGELPDVVGSRTHASTRPPPYAYPREAPTTTTKPVLALEPHRLATAAAGAYQRAIEARGGIFDPDQRHQPALAKLGYLAKAYAERTGGTVPDTLRAWAERYCDERQKRRPDWWLERVEAWVAEDGAAPLPGSGAALRVDLEAELAANKAAQGDALVDGDFDRRDALIAEAEELRRRWRESEGAAE